MKSVLLKIDVTHVFGGTGCGVINTKEAPILLANIVKMQILAMSAGSPQHSYIFQEA